MARIRYARVSRGDQHPTNQVRALEAAGCERIFTDHGVSGAKESRPELDACLAYLRPGEAPGGLAPGPSRPVPVAPDPRGG